MVSAGREGKSKGEFSRGGKSFRLLVEATDGAEEWLKDFQAVVDCTGTYGQGRWVFLHFGVISSNFQMAWRGRCACPWRKKVCRKGGPVSFFTQMKLLNDRWSTGYQMFWATKSQDTMENLRWWWGLELVLPLYYRVLKHWELQRFPEKKE